MSSPRTSNISRSSNAGAHGAFAEQIEQLTDAATVTINVSDFNAGYLATASQAITFANPSGTARNFQRYVIRICSASTQNLFWDTLFRGSATLELPASTTGGGSYDYVGFFYNSQSGTFDLLAKSLAYG